MSAVKPMECLIEFTIIIIITSIQLTSSTPHMQKNGIFYEENRAFKVVPRHGGGTTITDSIT